ncbi:unnamed protein product [Dibothriocephalus latus]|uniref:Major facilitator superfamily (MFS) profile domain-containing protein n=1 Tax=Dibothriocephalus latus TaxID=60516 RepID=A0A3P6TF08_DIBLA|nr:unnamed protein product [Dibothriocephalus latus]
MFVEAGMGETCGGIFLTRLTVNYGLGPYIITYCVMYGLGNGFPYSVIFQVASSWFPGKRTTVVGIISAGLGLGALVFTPIQTEIINPDDLQPDATGKYPAVVNQRVPNSFLILGGILLGCQLIALLLLRMHTELYGLENNFKDTFLAGIVMGGSIFNCIGRVVWGLITDQFSYKGPMMMFLSMWTFLFITFPFVAAGPAGIYLYSIWVLLLFLNLSGNFVILPGACNTLFGPKNYAIIYGLVYGAAAPSGLITAAVTAQLNLDGAWLPVYATCASFCAFGKQTVYNERFALIIIV